MNFLKNIGIQIPLLNRFYQTIHMQYDGKDLGLQLEDESGKLTLNVAQFHLDNTNTLSIGINLRIPVHTPIKKVKERFEKEFEKDPISIKFLSKADPLYVSKDHPLLITLSNVFHEITGLDATPIAIGRSNLCKSFSRCCFLWS